MGHRHRTLATLLAVFALGFAQGCIVPGRAALTTVDPAQRVFVSRQELFTLNHVRAGAPASCTARQVSARVARMSADTIVLDSILLAGGPRTGECRITGPAFVLRAEAPGLRIQAREVSVVRSLLAVAVLGTIALALVAIIYCDFGDGCFA